jgi:hypothetical protein
MKYVIMLDKDLGHYPYDWPVVKHSDNLDDLRRQTQWSWNPDSVPRDEWDMEWLEPKSLVYTETNECCTGAIYEQKKRPRKCERQP